MSQNNKLECIKLKNILQKDDSKDYLDNLQKWINNDECNCNLCNYYINLHKLMKKDDISIIMNNNEFKKINLNNTMKYKINNEINNQIVAKYIHKLIKQT